jgi:hypothetical protein
MGRAAQRLAILAAGVVLVACSSPPIDGILDCTGGVGIEFFGVSDLPGQPVRVPLDAARAGLDGLHDDDRLVHADVSHPEGVREAAAPGDVVVVRDGHEVAWMSFVERDGDWVAREGWHCSDAVIEPRDRR